MAHFKIPKFIPSAIFLSTILLVFSFGQTAFANTDNVILPQNFSCSSVFSKNLRIRSTGQAVSELQRILNISPDTRIAETGIGSPGNESDYFGPLTYKAVTKFQEKYAADILAPINLFKGTGFVGVNTRATIAEICSVLNSGMAKEDLMATALNGFNKIFYKNIKSYGSYRNSSSSKGNSSSGGGSSTPAPAPTPIKGSCGTTENICLLGTLNNTADSAIFYLWSCIGSNGGTTASCSIPIPTPIAPSSESKYSLHTNITAAVFWVGEPVGNGSSEDNALSAWDDEWQKNYGGYDDYQNRNGYYPAGFVPKENPFYLDLPFNDFNDNGTRKSNAYQIVPWANEKTWGALESMMKNRWVKITRNNVTCYGQIEDAGPYQYNDYAYVFSTTDARPKSTISNNAGMDVSPALRDCLKFQGVNNVDNKVDWQFVDFSNIPAGPWKEIITTSQINWP
jgi:peptidoglycan hydrolase-like protein with peptidoglycan-binding domain